MEPKSSTYSSKVYRGPEGRNLSAKDIAERLLPDLSMNELLCWAPDLFAYTSYLMSYTGAYQLVVSPPKGQVWKPENQEILKWLGIKIVDDRFEDDGLVENIENWLKDFVRETAKNEGDYQMLSPEEKEKWGFKPDWDPIKKAFSSSGASNEKKYQGAYSYERYFDNTFIRNIRRQSFKDVPNEIACHIQEQALSHLNEHPIGQSFKDPARRDWVELVESIGDSWAARLQNITPEDFYLINDGVLNENGKRKLLNGEIVQWDEKYEQYGKPDGHKLREEKLLGILLKYTPPLLIACWAFFYNKVNEKVERNNCKYKVQIAQLLCNRDDLQLSKEYCLELWEISQSLLTMHAIADICCTGWGIQTADEPNNRAQWFAEKLLFDKGSLSTINPGRGRVLPKRHNPGVGITLRSISSNIGFHRSSIDVVWRKTKSTELEERIKLIEGEIKKSYTFSLLLIPYPFDIRAKDFEEDTKAEEHVSFDKSKWGFFSFKPSGKLENKNITDLIERANAELDDNRRVDIMVFPETALSKDEYQKLQEAISVKFEDKSPSIFIAGVRETRDDIEEELSRRISNTPGYEDMQESEYASNFARNAVYCKYYSTDNSHPRTYKYNCTDDNSVIKDPTPKYKQYKHHRWRLDKPQIIRYGLSQALDVDDEKKWWEAIKVPRRRVSFLNIGDRITISTLVCEDLARQDPIADLIRHVGPSLVITLLMDGPQVKSRWSARYASILSDDPGSSVITLTSLGMVKRDTSFGLSRVIGLWSESNGGRVQEIGLAEGAEAVLLILKLDDYKEMTADDRKERTGTTVIKLLDMIQVYPN